MTSTLFDDCLLKTFDACLKDAVRNQHQVYLPLDYQTGDSSMRAGFLKCTVGRPEDQVRLEPDVEHPPGQYKLVLRSINGVFLLMPNLMKHGDDPDTIQFDAGISSVYYRANLSSLLFRVTEECAGQWGVNLKAHQSYRKTPHPLVYHTEQANTSTDDFVSQMIRGFQGFHFSNMRALRRTVFAIAANKTRDKLWKWYTSRQSGVHSEPRGVHLECPEKTRRCRRRN